MSWLVAAYPWVKSLHIVCVVAWMAGLLYLPRLFVYHASARKGSDAAETFKVMERRLLKGIMTPAMIGAYAFGVVLLATPGVVDWRLGWIHAKLAGVVALTVMHGFLAHWRHGFETDSNSRSANFYRAINEIPTVLMIVIVVMVVVKPF